MTQIRHHSNFFTIEVFRTSGRQNGGGGTGVSRYDRTVMNYILIGTTAPDRFLPYDLSCITGRFFTSLQVVNTLFLRSFTCRVHEQYQMSSRFN